MRQVVLLFFNGNLNGNTFWENSLANVFPVCEMLVTFAYVILLRHAMLQLKVNSPKHFNTKMLLAV